ncbi:MAG: hypothetical protein EOP06_25130, partial [Proteobacteria bacterium]
MKAILVSLMATLFTFGPALASDNQINVLKLNQTLQAKGAGWTAKDNWLNHLSKPELKRMMGLKDTPHADVDFAAPKKLTQDALPVSLDWRNKDGKNWVSPILN